MHLTYDLSAVAPLQLSVFTPTLMGFSELFIDAVFFISVVFWDVGCCTINFHTSLRFAVFWTTEYFPPADHRVRAQLPLQMFSTGVYKERLKLEWLFRAMPKHVTLSQSVSAYMLCTLGRSRCLFVPYRIITSITIWHFWRAKTIMAQTERGWGGICQCSRWGSKVECKMSVFV